jgi:hypothetical protein
MSNLVLSMPRGDNGSFTWPITKYPVFNTIEQKTAAFRGSTYVSLTQYPIWRFDFDVPFLRGRLSDPNSPVSLIMGMILAMRGRADTFLFDDPWDRTAVKAGFGTGDGTTTAFQISRPIGPGIDIIQTFNGSPQIYANNVLQTSGYSIDSFGVITFTAAPAASATLTWSGNFLYRCRFTDDANSNFRQIAPEIWDCSQLVWESVII